jgi:hypothetical protein
MKDAKHREVQEQVDRMLVKRWTLTEMSAMLEPVSFRVLTSWISGKPLRIAPAVWKPEHFLITPVPDRKPDKRAKYGFPNLLQFILARELFAARVNRDVIQNLCDHVAGSDNTTLAGYYLILTGVSDNQPVFSFRDREQLLKAISENPAPLPQCFVLDCSAILGEALGRADAWEKRESYVPRVRESVIAEARHEWIQHQAKNLVAAIKRSAKG